MKNALARRDLVEPLAHQGADIVRDIPRVAGVSNAAHHVTTEPQLLIELTDEQQAGIGREGAARKIDLVSSAVVFGGNVSPITTAP